MYRWKQASSMLNLTCFYVPTLYLSDTATILMKAEGLSPSLRPLAEAGTFHVDNYQRYVFMGTSGDICEVTFINVFFVTNMD